ncbi:MAG: 30S ribosomal protein S9 [Candidatus Omnitrophica bacterium]|nr:30S ribosomal protein S9 [Candidatus Omnitrophota bacterium]
MTETSTETSLVFSGTGRRKEAIARVRLVPGDGTKFMVNGRLMENFFARDVHQIIVRQPLKLVKAAEVYDVISTVRGGGETGQAGAIRMGIARALVVLDPTAKKILRQGGFLTRDSRAKERKKYGRRGARRGIQYSKR